MTGENYPIDAVVTWVDGTDPLHSAKLSAYLQSIGQVHEAANPTRFRETGEFEFCIASLLRFAPWLRKIYIVTDDQRPEFMSIVSQSPNRDRIILIDHNVIFSGFEQYLPTFNSRSIGTALWRIPGLSQHFLYLADDMLLLRPVTPHDFFSGDKMVVRGRWFKQYEYRWDVRAKHFLEKFLNSNSNKPIPRPGMRLGQSSSAAAAGFTGKYFRLPHVHHPQIRSLIEEFYTENKTLFEKNSSVRLRSSEQFSPEALATHLAFRRSRAIIDNRLSSLFLMMDKTSAIWLKIRLVQADVSGRFAFGCIQSLDLAKPYTRKIIMTWIENRIGRLSENINREYTPFIP